MNMQKNDDSIKCWAWAPGVVDKIQEHLELRYGSVDVSGWDGWIPTALVGPPNDKVFHVQFIAGPETDGWPEIQKALMRELNFYLVELNNVDPWAYAKYHCSTAANVYSNIHWSYFEGA